MSEVIVVTSGKGGVGKTTTSANVGTGLAKLNKKVIFVNKTRGQELEEAINEMNFKDVLLIENTRFEDLDGKKESLNDSSLGSYWASLGDIFINDAFGTSHRAHASNVGIASHLPSGIGFLVEKELNIMLPAINNPKRPLTVILGGSKVSDKIGVIENLVKIADNILIGGGMAFTFLKAMGYEVGNSICELDRLDIAKETIEKAKMKGVKLLLPIDTVCGKEFTNDTETVTVDSKQIPEGWQGLDIGPKAIEEYTQELKNAKTVIWNGPLGVFEFEKFAKGTNSIAKVLSELDATTIVGGGDSVAAIEKGGFSDKITHISTGGGASLEFLEGKALPGIEALNDK